MLEYLKFDAHVHSDSHVDRLPIDHHAKLERFAEKEQVRMAKAKGLLGFALTNHEFDQKTFERVAAIDPSLIIVPSQEVATDDGSTHVLAIGVKKNIATDSLDSVVRAIRKQGAIAVLAHPFRSKISAVGQFPATDGAEVFNGSAVLRPEANWCALACAQDLGEGYIKLAGSDSHFMPGFAVPGRSSTLLASKPKDWQDLVTNVRKYVVGFQRPDAYDDKQFWDTYDFEEISIDPDIFAE